MNKPNLIMLVGLPGSGKSTYCNLNHKNTNIISLDRLIEKTMTPGETYVQAFVRVQKSGELKEMDRKMFVIAKSWALIPELDPDVFMPDIIWDQTNLTVKSRARKLEIFKSEYWTRHCVCFELSDREWQNRLDKRQEETGKSIPRYVLDDMKASYVRPTKDEGFESIVLFNDHGLNVI